MENRIRRIAGIWMSFGVGLSLCAQGYTASSGTFEKEEIVTTRASGSFDVKLTPQATVYQGVGAQFGRMSIDKQFHGELAGLAGEMDIKIEAGKHYYEFEYTLPENP